MTSRKENNTSAIQLIECPRDAMQGWKPLIPTARKIEYLNALLKVGFDILDFGSFVSAKVIPQLADTLEVLNELNRAGSRTRLLAIVANLRGAEEAANCEEIHYLGFPFSVSETFQLRNTHKTIEDSLLTVQEIKKICDLQNKELVIYLSMGFGNPYGDPYSPNIVFDWACKMAEMDIQIISLADTVGLASPEQVFSVTDHLIRKLPDHTIGVHLHSSPANQQLKIEAAVRAGCQRFDGALKGIGGCPMAHDELVGNIDTAFLVDYFGERNLLGPLDREALGQCMRLADEIFAGTNA